jgi:hypothetical protein
MKLKYLPPVQADVRLPSLPQFKQDNNQQPPKKQGPSLYNFYQRIIDRTAGIDVEDP